MMIYSPKRRVVIVSHVIVSHVDIATSSQNRVQLITRVYIRGLADTQLHAMQSVCREAGLDRTARLYQSCRFEWTLQRRYS